MDRRIAVAATLALFAAPALAAEMPARRAGLWDITTRADGGRTPAQKSQHCIDAETDKMMNAFGNAMQKEACARQDIKRVGDSIVIDTECSFGGFKSTSHSVVTGDFSKAYTVKVESKIDGAPAMPGMKPGEPMRTTIEAKWLGACKPGQKPGDIVMSNGMTMNIRDMRNLPGMMPRR